MPSSIVGATDAAAIKLLYLTKRAIKECKDRYMWPKLNKEYTFTLSTSVENYALPADFDRQVHRTHWNRTRKWELLGPMTPQEWQFRKSGITATTPRQYFRVKSWENETFFIYPTPTSGDNGATIVFEYQSDTAVVPQTWVSGNSAAASSYCSYDGNIYFTTAGGTNGATPPTHTGGAVSDGAVVWNYRSSYAGYLADTDFCLIDEDLITLSLIWRILAQKGLEYSEAKAAYEAALNREIVAERGAKTLSLSPGFSEPFLSGFNIPDSGFGT